MYTTHFSDTGNFHCYGKYFSIAQRQHFFQGLYGNFPRNLVMEIGSLSQTLCSKKYCNLPVCEINVYRLDMSYVFQSCPRPSSFSTCMHFLSVRYTISLRRASNSHNIFGLYVFQEGIQNNFICFIFTPPFSSLRHFE